MESEWEREWEKAKENAEKFSGSCWTSGPLWQQKLIHPNHKTANGFSFFPELFFLFFYADFYGHQLLWKWILNSSLIPLHHHSSIRVESVFNSRVNVSLLRLNSKCQTQTGWHFPASQFNPVNDRNKITKSAWSSFKKKGIILHFLWRMR